MINNNKYSPAVDINKQFIILLLVTFEFASHLLTFLKPFKIAYLFLCYSNWFEVDSLCEQKIKPLSTTFFSHIHFAIFQTLNIYFFFHFFEKILFILCPCVNWISLRIFSIHFQFYTKLFIWNGTIVCQPEDEFFFTIICTTRKMYDDDEKRNLFTRGQTF